MTMKTKNFILSTLITVSAFAFFSQSAFAEGKTRFILSMDSQHACQVDQYYAIIELSRENTTFRGVPVTVSDHCLVIESWMTTPFETPVSEEALSIENWMVELF
jgi:hypothetical protein